MYACVRTCRPGNWTYSTLRRNGAVGSTVRIVSRSDGDGAREATAFERVVSAVADAGGVDPTALPPLYEAVDPERLAGPFAGTARGDARSGGVVSFRWADRRVVVEGREVTVRVEKGKGAASSTNAAFPVSRRAGSTSRRA